MNQALVDKIANAVLYEGYILYPYRPSVKSRQRWTFGGLVPQSYSLAQRGSDAWVMQTECLVEASANAALSVQVRFLHLQLRRIGELPQPLSTLPAEEEVDFRAVASLVVGGQPFFAWQEAVERTIVVDDFNLAAGIDQPHRRSFAFPARRQQEALRQPTGEIVGVLRREQEAIEGLIEVSAARAAGNLLKARVRIVNATPLEDAGQKSRDEALARSLISTHTILGVRAGAFVSSLDPPDRWREAAAGCRNEGAWPVLVGEAGQKDTMLSSPIILYDYPQIAPESAGDLFDATEIDEILTLRILTLTDQEKEAMAAVDERARALLQRTEALGPRALLGLHGVVRGLRPVAASKGES